MAGDDGGWGDDIGILSWRKGDGPREKYKDRLPLVFISSNTNPVDLRDGTRFVSIKFGTSARLSQGRPKNKFRNK